MGFEQHFWHGVRKFAFNKMLSHQNTRRFLYSMVKLNCYSQVIYAICVEQALWLLWVHFGMGIWLWEIFLFHQAPCWRGDTVAPPSFCYFCMHMFGPPRSLLPTEGVRPVNHKHNKQCEIIDEWLVGGDSLINFLVPGISQTIFPYQLWYYSTNYDQSAVIVSWRFRNIGLHQKLTWLFTSKFYHFCCL